mmetsp:Transcript_43402/g.85639  ORF Transcript_43402/g.85639 Transcript_43402/m.85639 type:complete len:92 (-) Transcript_43402:1975-2250(-)
MGEEESRSTRAMDGSFGERMNNSTDRMNRPTIIRRKLAKESSEKERNAQQAGTENFEGEEGKERTKRSNGKFSLSLPLLLTFEEQGDTDRR